MRRILRGVASLLGLAILVLLSLAYGTLPELTPSASPPAGAKPTALEFHRFDRAEVAGLDAPANPCGTCHPAAAHQRNGELRAYLNLHRRALDCGVCHLRGKSVGVRHFRNGRAVTSETLTDAPYGRVYAAVKTADGWRRVQRPGDGVTLRSAGPGCRDCHRRGSPLLATDGLLDGYRRRVLEDLSVLRFLETAR